MVIAPSLHSQQGRRGISPPGPAGLAIHVGTDTYIYPYIYIIYHRILALYMGVCMHGDGSGPSCAMVAQGLPRWRRWMPPPMAPWLPRRGGGCLLPPVLHAMASMDVPWHDGTPQTRADVDGMPKQHWMHAAGACMCANRWHTVCTCAHYAGSSDPSHCPHAPGARELACVVATAGMQALFCRGMCPWAVAGRLTRLSQRLQPTACLQRCKQVLDQTR